MSIRWICVCWFALLTPAPSAAGGVADSVVRVWATVRDPDMLRPLLRRKPVEIAASGAIIENKQILTNAHVVLYAEQIHIAAADGKKLPAKLKAIAAGLDLAVLTVADKDFFAGRPALPRSAKLPREKSLVKICGYPLLQDKLAFSPTKVLLVDYLAYSPQLSGVQVQLEKVVEAGMSGGPVLQGADMIGLALSLGKNDRCGHVIPNEEIDTFLKDVADGSYDGKPWLDIPLQSLQNEALRQKLRLGPSVQGLVVTRAAGPLQRFDVLTKVSGYYVDNDGMVRVDDKLRSPFQYLVPQVVREGKVRLGLLREGEAVKLDFPVARPGDFLIRELNGKYPPYLVYGPLVFSTATLESGGQILQLNDDPAGPLVQRRNDRVRFPGEELVVVTAVFPHKCLADLPNPLGRAVREVNGVAVKNLPHLRGLLRANRNEFVTFEFAGTQTDIMVLRRRDMVRVTQEIMKKNDIPSRSSGD